MSAEAGRLEVDRLEIALLLQIFYPDSLAARDDLQSIISGDRRLETPDDIADDLAEILSVSLGSPPNRKDSKDLNLIAERLPRRTMSLKKSEAMQLEMRLGEDAETIRPILEHLPSTPEAIPDLEILVNELASYEHASM